MFLLLSCKRMPVPSPSWRNVGHSTTHLSFLLDFAPIFQGRPFSSVGVAKDLDKHSFTVSYLINSCGLSPASAKVVSKLVQFRDSAKQDRLLNCLRSHGFTDAHILKVVRIQPILLLLDAEKTVLPKFEFFHSIGISGAELADLISRNPTLLACSLNHKIIPCYNFLKSELVHNEVVVKSFKNTTRILLERVEKNVCTNLFFMSKGTDLQYFPKLAKSLAEGLFHEMINKYYSLWFFKGIPTGPVIQLYSFLISRIIKLHCHEYR